MIDTLVAVVGSGLIGILATVTGVRLGVRKSNAAARTVRAVCDCGHPRGTHADDKRCVTPVRRVAYDKYGERSGKQYVACPCMRYTGPKPFEELYPHPVLPPAKEL